MILEQRIGRVHRIGQRDPVRVVNFVAAGTIEQSMLTVLRFKKSLFAGVLDGGEKEVFLGKGRLDRFMEKRRERGRGDPAGAFRARNPRGRTRAAAERATMKRSSMWFKTGDTCFARSLPSFPRFLSRCVY